MSLLYQYNLDKHHSFFTCACFYPFYRDDNGDFYVVLMDPGHFRQAYPKAVNYMNSPLEYPRLYYLDRGLGTTIADIYKIAVRKKYFKFCIENKALETVVEERKIKRVAAKILHVQKITIDPFGDRVKAEILLPDGTKDFDTIVIGHEIEGYNEVIAFLRDIMDNSQGYDFAQYSLRSRLKADSQNNEDFPIAIQAVILVGMLMVLVFSLLGFIYSYTDKKFLYFGLAALGLVIALSALPVYYKIRNIGYNKAASKSSINSASMNYLHPSDANNNPGTPMEMFSAFLSEQRGVDVMLIDSFITRVKKELGFDIKYVRIVQRKDSHSLENREYGVVPYLNLFPVRETCEKLWDGPHNTDYSKMDGIKTIWRECVEQSEVIKSEYYDKKMHFTIQCFENMCYESYARYHKYEVENYFLRRFKLRPKAILASSVPSLNIVFETEDYERLDLAHFESSIQKDIKAMADRCVESHYGHLDCDFKVNIYHPKKAGYSSYGMYRED